LIEAVTLCLTGGLIGLVIGASSALALANWGAWPIALSPALVLIALAAAALVGVFFGYYPARRASLINPIDALRTSDGQWELWSSRARVQLPPAKDQDHAQPRLRPADRRRRSRRHGAD